MKCTDKTIKKRKRKANKRLIQSMKILLFMLCVVAVAIAFFKFIKKDEQHAAAYEAATYNTHYFKEDLLSTDLCVSTDNVSSEYSPDTSSLKSAALFDVTNAETSYAYNIHKKIYPASTTKILTALVAIENGDLSEEVIIGKNADSTNFAADEQTCGILKGDTVTLEDLLYGLILYSGNDVAVAIAEHISGGEEEFAELMNAKAAELMATNSHFVNPSGLHDDNHYTTAYDLYLIFNECIKHEEFVEILGTSEYKTNIKGADGETREVTWEPTNFYALGTKKAPEHVTVVGGKTGTLLSAGNCLILLVESPSGDPYITLVMGAQTKDHLYKDLTAIMEGIPGNNLN